MTRSTVQVLNILQHRREATPSEIAAETDVSERTVKSVLNELQKIRLVDRRRESKSDDGAGKPPFVYSLTDQSSLTGINSEYPLLVLEELAAKSMEIPRKRQSPEEHIVEMYLLLADAIYYLRDNNSKAAASVLIDAFDHLIYVYSQLRE